MPRSCAFGCSSKGTSLHRFPDEKKFPERLKAWVSLVGGQLESASDFQFYKKKMVCDRHFTNADRNRHNRLNNLSIPSLHLQGYDATLDEGKLFDDAGASKEDTVENEDTTKDYAGASIEGTVGNEDTTIDDAGASVEDTVETEDRTIADDCNGLPEEESHLEPEFSWQKAGPISVEDYFLNKVPVSRDVTEDYKNNSCVGQKSASTKDADSESTTHIEYTCDHCTEEIIGFRYTCVECENFDLCIKCEGKMVHPQHYMLRVPRPRPYTEVKSIIEAVREKIKLINEKLGQSIDIEIKNEEITDDDRCITQQETFADVEMESVPDLYNISEQHVLKESEEWLDEALLEFLEPTSALSSSVQDGHRQDDHRRVDQRQEHRKQNYQRQEGYRQNNQRVKDHRQDDQRLGEHRQGKHRKVVKRNKKRKRTQPKLAKKPHDPLSQSNVSEKSEETPLSKCKTTEIVGMKRILTGQIIRKIWADNTKDGEIIVEKEVNTNKGSVKRRFLLKVVRQPP